MKMTDMVKEFFGSNFERVEGNPGVHISSDTLPTGQHEDIQNQLSVSSTYILARDQSQVSRDVDLWLQDHTANETADTGIQLSRIPLAQRSTSASIPSRCSTNGTWYILAVLLPFFSINNYPQWRCSPSAILNTVALFASHIGATCVRVRSGITRLAQDQITREIMATTMDTILVVYAIGFLILSMYQASIIG